MLFRSENDDFGRLDILEYEIDSVQTVSATDNDNQDIEMTAEMIKTMVKALDDTPRKQEKIHDEIVQDIDFSMRD